MYLYRILPDYTITNKYDVEEVSVQFIFSTGLPSR